MVTPTIINLPEPFGCEIQPTFEPVLISKLTSFKDQNSSVGSCNSPYFYN